MFEARRWRVEERVWNESVWNVERVDGVLNELRPVCRASVRVKKCNVASVDASARQATAMTDQSLLSWRLAVNATKLCELGAAILELTAGFEARARGLRG